MHVDDDRGRRARLGELLDADRERQSVESGAAVAPRNEHTQQPGLGRRVDRFLGKPMVAVDLGRERLHHPLREFTHTGAEAGVLGREFEVQLRRYLE